MDDTPVLKNVKGLSREEVKREIKQRGLEPAGVPAEDVTILQGIYQEEFENEMELFKKAEAELLESLREKELEIQRRKQILKEKEENKNLIKSDLRLASFLDLARANKTTGEVHFSGNPALARCIASTVQSCKSLIVLDLSSGSIGDSGAIAFAKVLGKEGLFLRRLDLSENSIGSEGFSAIARSLSVNNSLTSLSVEGNDITNDQSDFSGVQALGDSLEVNETLSVLNLNRTCLGADGISLIAGYTKKWKHLVSLEIEANGVLKPSDVQTIIETLDKNRLVKETVEASEFEKKKLLRQNQRHEQKVAEDIRKEIKYQEECDNRARERQLERIRLFEEEKQARQDELENGKLRAMEKQALWAEANDSKKKKGKKK